MLNVRGSFQFMLRSFICVDEPASLIICFYNIIGINYDNILAMHVAENPTTKMTRTAVRSTTVRYYIHVHVLPLHAVT